MRLPVDPARRDDRPGQPHVRDLDGLRARRPRRRPAAAGPARPGRADLPRDALQPAAADAGVGARDRDRVRARRRDAAARAGQLDAAPRRRRPPAAGSGRRCSTRATAAATSRSCCAPSATSSEIALRLQRSMLSGALPEAPSFDARGELPPRPSAASRSAATGTTRSGSTAATRSGSSSATSSAAGSRRPRRWASCAAPSARSRRPGLGPAALLDALDGYARRHEVGRMATRHLRRARPRLARAALRLRRASAAGRHRAGRRVDVRLGRPLAAARRVHQESGRAARGRADARPRRRRRCSTRTG